MRVDFKNTLNITVEIELLSEGVLERTEGKSKRVKRVL